MLNHLLSTTAFLLLSTGPALAQGSFSFATDQAPRDAVIPAVVPVIFQVVSPGDAPLILRSTTLLNNAWFDAIAPYHETASGICSSIPRRPVAERTDTNRNIAIFYASLRMLDSLYPTYTTEWHTLMTSVGLDPLDTSTDLTTPIGIGNVAGAAVVAARENDGMNQLGNEQNPLLSERTDVGRPYWDYTGYAPVNTPYELVDAGRWQPSILDNGYGIFRVQQFITPQYGNVRPFSMNDPIPLYAPPPVASDPANSFRYKLQADKVLAASASLTDRQKMIAELFDDKISSLGFSALFVTVSQGMSLEEFVHYDFLTNLAAFDTGIIIWREKRRYDAVRPFTAIRHIYGDDLVTAWGGPGQGTVSLPASKWKSYLPVADHPEYPSASAAFCAAHAQSSRLYLGTDTLNWSLLVPQGTSRIEPGHTPLADLTISFATWTEFEEECGMSRFWGGVHFESAIPAGQDIGTAIGTRAYGYLMRHIQGLP
jgi:hypothetical protein